MENDRSTIPDYINIVVENNPAYIKKLEEQADSDSQNDEESNIIKFSIREDGHKVTPDEIYFEDGELHISCNLISKEGSTYVCLEVPLSQGVLFDILGESIKKFNKIKTIMEATN